MTHDAEVYATQKVLYHRGSMDALLAGKQPYPKHIELVISDWCSHDCLFCSYRMSGHPSNTLFQMEEGTDRKARNPKRMIPVEKCLEILDDCAEMGVKAIQFTGGGEPTIHPDFCQIVAYAMGKGLETALITNGNMMLENNQRALAKRMTWLRISIDAAHQEHYMEERGVGRGAWDRMVEGATLLCREATEENPSLVIGSGFVVTPRNYDQIYEAARLYKNIGFHNMRIGLMFNPEEERPFVEIWPEIRRQASEAVRDFSCPEFRVIDRTQERFDEFAGLGDGVINYQICGFQNFTNFIGGDQNLYRCCMWAFHPHGLIGSIKNQRLKMLYDSIEKHQDFARFDPHSCGKCQFNQTNKAINAAIADPDILDRIDPSKPPMHHNFT